MPLQFHVPDSSTGVFAYPDSEFDPALEVLDSALEQRSQGQLTDKAYAALLERIIAEHPDFIDAHAHLAYLWIEQGKPKKALDASLAGLTLANRLVPEGFAGHIEWGHLDNRPYLRAMHGAVLAYGRLRRHKEAAGLIECMLAYNPNDNQGVRYLLGSELLRAGDAARAQTVFEAECASYPPYHYEVALAHLQAGRWVPAATALRRGFCVNRYIAEALSGWPDPKPLAIWHGSNLAEPETARDYLGLYGSLWMRRPDFPAFVRWLFNHSRVLAERAAITACQEALCWEHEFSARGAIIDRQDRLVAAIDDSLSIAVIERKQDRRGQSIYPWMLDLLG
ncbi:MAG: tetratricopeptide repeat protein [Vitreoscilla sp.]|jgi:tetratricopeptide (TPR) repeat protein|nr:tetratricopeptide repeat protein [Vitreoscilla sp.]